jgi:hypothetical protein
VKVALYGAGQVAHRVAEILSARSDVAVIGPCGREARDSALASHADVVVIATTSFLADVAPDIRTALEHSSNVITTAEEAAFPWAVDATVADELDALARTRGVSVMGAGINPGFLFDALVLTAMGPVSRVDSIRVTRNVDLSGFSATVLRRIGVGHNADAFAQGIQSGTITGHIGFRQSMLVVGARLGITLERVDQTIEPLFATQTHDADHISVASGATAGFRQKYVGIVHGEAWFEADFLGHLSLPAISLTPRDEIFIAGSPAVHLMTDPGINPQTGAAAMVANSVSRLFRAPPGWVMVGDLPPAVPRV